MMFRSPATEFVPETVTAAVLLVFPIVKPLVPVKAQVGSKVCAELKEVEDGSIDTVPEVFATTTPDPLLAVTSKSLSPIIFMLEDDDPDSSAPK
jgi:hypothetical protein